MKSELKGIKVEVEDDDHLFRNDMTESELVERYEQSKDIVSFEQMELHVNLENETDVNSAIMFLEKTTETSIKQIVLRRVYLHDESKYDKENRLLELIRTKKMKYPEISLKLRDPVTKITNEQWNDSDRKMVIRAIREKELKFD